MEESEKKKDKKIMVIEDNAIFRDLLVEKLEEAGYSTATTEGNVSLEEIAREKPDLLLLDIVSSDSKSSILIKQLKQGTRLPTIPIIAIAKLKESVVVDYARELGVKDSIDRVVFDSKDLLEKIEKILKFPREDLADGTKEPLGTGANDSKKENKGKILLVEDDTFMRELFARGLAEAGFTVDSAPDAESGLEILTKNVPELVLLDLLLPGKSGFNFLEEIKQNKLYENIPVIVVSNLGSKGDIDNAMDLGAADFLVKANSTINEIVSKSERFIEKSRKSPMIPESLQ